MMAKLHFGLSLFVSG